MMKLNVKFRRLLFWIDQACRWHPPSINASKAAGKEPAAPPLPPPPPKKRALLIGISQVRQETTRTAAPEEDSDPQSSATAPAILKGPHHEVKEMCALLQNKYGYDLKDITILLDHPDYEQPTRENILRRLRLLVNDARSGDKFFFHYSGHSDQESTDDIEEEDRKNEYIITSDNDKILDDELRHFLVKPLPAGSSLTAIFDSCHSGTLLDLKHFRCNAVFLPFINKGERRTMSMWIQNKRRMALTPEDSGPSRIGVFNRDVKRIDVLRDGIIRRRQNSIGQVLLSNGAAKNLNLNTSPITSKTKTTSLALITDLEENKDGTWLGLESSASPLTQYNSPQQIYCDGFHCNVADILNGPPQADVISLSSSADNQETWEDGRGTSMTSALIKILSETPNPTLTSLLTRISLDLHQRYVDLHSKALIYRKQVRKINEKRRKKGKELKEAFPAEMNNFQIPQLSSERPLDRNRVWDP